MRVLTLMPASFVGGRNRILNLGFQIFNALHLMPCTPFDRLMALSNAEGLNLAFIPFLSLTLKHHKATMPLT